MKYHLLGKYHSGRAVELKMLDGAECDEILDSAAKLVGSEATLLQLRKREFSIGVRRFLVSYTDAVDAVTPETKWKTVKDPFEMDEKFNSLFTTKDIKVLEKLYRDFHEVSQEEVDAITGKSLDTPSAG